jgi:polysaccharide pyruvyl transferase WcaK-like protein
MEPESFEVPFITGSDVPVIGVNIARGSIRQVVGHDPSEIEKVYQIFGQALEQMIVKLGVRIVLIPHSQGSDHKFHSRFYEKLRTMYPDQIWVLPISLGARKTKWAVSKCTGLVATRFHCSLAGFSSCTPTLLVLSKPKGARIAQDMYGNMDCTIEMKQLTADSLFEKTKMLLDNRDSLRSVLQGTCKQMQERAFHAGELVEQIVAERV